MNTEMYNSPAVRDNMARLRERGVRFVDPGEHGGVRLSDPFRTPHSGQDGIGAEHLMGKGDMLYLPPDASAPLRIQGCFVSDREIEAVVGHWQAVAPPPVTETQITPAAEQAAGTTGAQEAPWERLIVRQAFVSERDEMLEEAIALAKKNDKISTSYIQRRLRIGYPRAARLMEALYEMGLVEDPREGGRTRRTYVSEEDDPLDELLT